MTWTLGRRLGVTLVLACGVVVALHFLLGRLDDRSKPKPRVLPMPATDGIDAQGDPAADPLRAVPHAALRLRATRGTIALCRRLRSLAPDIAPVVEVLADGDVVLRRPAPLAARPGAAPPLSREGHGAAVVLPVGDVGDLAPPVRSALVGLLGCWVEERPIGLARIAPIDLVASEGALRRLLSWVP